MQHKQKNVKMEELIDKVLVWAKDKGIFEKGTIGGQSLKTVEEAYELVKATYEKDEAEMSDARGDILVTLIILGHMLGLNIKHLIVYLDPENYGDSVLTDTAVLATACTLHELCKTLEQGSFGEIDKTVRLKHLIGSIVHRLCFLGEPISDLQGAYNVISQRKGKMENGIFVKDGN